MRIDVQNVIVNFLKSIKMSKSKICALCSTGYISCQSGSGHVCSDKPFEPDTETLQLVELNIQDYKKPQENTNV